MDIDDPFKSSPEEESKTPATVVDDIPAQIHDFEHDLNQQAVFGLAQAQF